MLKGRGANDSPHSAAPKYQEPLQYGYATGSQGGDEDCCLEEEEEQYEEIDERNDVYTAKGNGLPPTTQSVQSLRSRENLTTVEHQIGALRQLASSANGVQTA